MARGSLSSAEIKLLLSNPNVISADNHRIVYSNQFKLHFMEEYNRGKKPTQIFREAGFDPEVLGSKRIERAAARWKESFAAGTLGEYPDHSIRHKEAVKTHSKLELKEQQLSRQHENYLNKIDSLEQTYQEKLSKKQKQIDDLQAQIELLKKAGSLGRRRCENKVFGKIDLCELVEDIHRKYGDSCSIRSLCKVLDLPRSTYYYYLSRKQSRQNKEDSDLEALFFIKKIFDSRKHRCKGSRSIKDALELDFEINYNRKKIQRIMRKFNIKCPIKTVNPYKGIWKATKEDRIAPNLLNRNFKPGSARKVLLTDITYIRHQGRFSYLSVILDSQTNEPIAYTLSDNLRVDFTLDSLRQLNLEELSGNVIIHSDQGVHYSSKAYRCELEKLHITQSMSRRGNCLDNSPMESFFAHLKAEMDIDPDWSYAQLQNEIDDYMHDYRYCRRQRTLGRLTPYEYGSTLLANAA